MTHTPIVAVSVTLALAWASLSAGSRETPHSSIAERLRAQATQASSTPSLKGKTILITGSTDGLGREAALRSATAGAHVIVHGRNKERGDAVVQEITRDGKGSARFYAADFASLAGVRAFAATILADYPRIDVLVNNAGVLVLDKPVESADGLELHFAVNYLATFLLTRTLLPRIVASAPARIVNVASISASPIDFNDVMLKGPGRFSQGYGQSKLAEVMFTFDLAPELQGKGVSVTALHPATMMDTTMVRGTGMAARSTVDEGADALMNQIAGNVTSGEFYNGLMVSRAHAQAYDAGVRATLRALSMQLTGLAAR